MNPSRDGFYKYGREAGKYGGKYHHRTGKSYEETRGKPMQRRGRELEPKPMPLGRKCNPLCPYFRCSKKALVIKQSYKQGRIVRTAYCRWIGDTCIGASCQYAYCALKALLPNGECLYALKKETRETEDMFKELGEKDLEDRAEDMLARKYGKKLLEEGF